MSDPTNPSKKALCMKIRPETDAKLRSIAAENGLSLQDVINLALTIGLPVVESKFSEMLGRPSSAQAA